jgi:hypothetical protein
LTKEKSKNICTTKHCYIDREHLNCERPELKGYWSGAGKEDGESAKVTSVRHGLLHKCYYLVYYKLET